MTTDPLKPKRLTKTHLPHTHVHACGTDDCTGCMAHGCARHIPLFNTLNSSQFELIAAKIKRRNYEAGSLLFSPGDPCERLTIIRKGKVKLYQLNAAGKEYLRRILIPGDFTGELAVAGEMTYADFAQAMTHVQVCSIDRHDFRELMADSIEISISVLNALAVRVEAAENRSAELATGSIAFRLQEFLRTLVREQHTPSITLPMSRKEMASYLGTTAESISRQLKRWERSGIIRQENRRKISLMGEIFKIYDGI